MAAGRRNYGSMCGEKYSGMMDRPDKGNTMLGDRNQQRNIEKQIKQKKNANSVGGRFVLSEAQQGAGK